MYVCVSQEPERLDGYYSNLVSESSSVVDLFPVNLNIASPKLGVHQMGCKTLIGDFLENGFNDFDYISVTYVYEHVYVVS
jgi:hypothetical protein